MAIVCSSRVSHVTVHARGALVTREASVPRELPEGEVDLLLPDVTVLAEAGSVRASVSGARTLVSVETSLFVPGAKPVEGKVTEQLRLVEARLERAVNER